jgi:hypothetical protein
VPIILNSGSLNLLEPSGLVQACNGIALPLPLLDNIGVRMKGIPLPLLDNIGVRMKGIPLPLLDNIGARMKGIPLPLLDNIDVRMKGIKSQDQHITTHAITSRRKRCWGNC